MPKVKLDLVHKTDDDLRLFAKEHRDALVGNAHFPVPLPTAAEFDAALADFTAMLEDVAVKEIALQTARAKRDGGRGVMERLLNARGSYVDLEAEGNGEVILSSGFKLQASAAPTTSLPAPAGVTAGMGAGTGEISVGCQPVAKARTYVFEMREHDDTEVPGPWAQVKLASRSTAVITGLTPGKRYAFRIRVVGPNDIQSPWSVEISCMAP